MLRSAALVVLLIASPLAAQVHHVPTDRPLVTAANEPWYQTREPILFAGDVYYRAGAAVFFDGKIMVRSGYHNGVPLYMNTTLEPYSMILVPVGRGLLQPYERLRRGSLAGTTGSRTPSFPVRTRPDGFSFAEAAGASTAIGEPIRPTDRIEESVPVATGGEIPLMPLAAPVRPAMPEVRAATMIRPESNDGVWLRYRGTKWVSAGAAVPLDAGAFRAIGAYEGFPVFARRDDEQTIYLPTRGGLVAPYAAR
jgi:hypothetical protein